MTDERNRIRLFQYSSKVMAIVLGIYSQDIAYFLNRNLEVPLKAGIGTSAILSITLFVIPPILVSKKSRQSGISAKEFNIYLGINILIGFVVTAFSLIVLAVWYG